MNVENGLRFLSKEKVAKAAVVTIVFTIPVAGLIAKKELSLLKAKKEQQSLTEKALREAIKISQDSINSGDSRFYFSSPNLK